MMEDAGQADANERIRLAAHEHLTENFSDNLETLRRYLRQPGISLTGHGMQQSADGTAALLRDAGATDVSVLPMEGGWPVVYGRIASPDPNPRTLLFLSMYDVMPAEEDDWVSPPFGAELVEPDRIGLPKEAGQALVSRGTTNTRGPLVAFLDAVRAIRAVRGALPLNILFVIEGEEELGSPNLPVFRDQFLAILKEADAVITTRTHQTLAGEHRIYLGTKGMVTIELVVEGGEWGGPVVRDLHSSDHIWVDAPAWELVHALAALTDRDGKMRIPGLTDALRPWTAEERELIDQLTLDFDDVAHARSLGIKRWRGDRRGRDWVGDWVMAPLMNIDGLIAGYTGPGIQTVMPRRATAKLDIRFVPDMTAEHVVAALRRHLDRLGFAHVQVEVGASVDWSRTSVTTRLAQTIIRSTTRHGLKPLVAPNTVGSNPLARFTGPPLSLPGATFGLGHGARAHVANEYITVDTHLQSQQFNATFLLDYARTVPSEP